MPTQVAWLAQLSLSVIIFCGALLALAGLKRILTHTRSVLDYRRRLLPDTEYEKNERKKGLIQACLVFAVVIVHAGISLWMF